MMWEFMHTVRIIPTDGRRIFRLNCNLFMGDPVATGKATPW